MWPRSTASWFFRSLTTVACSMTLCCFSSAFFLAISNAVFRSLNSWSLYELSSSSSTSLAHERPRLTLRSRTELLEEEEFDPSRAQPASAGEAVVPKEGRCRSTWRHRLRLGSACPWRSRRSSFSCRGSTRTIARFARQVTKVLTPFFRVSSSLTTNVAGASRGPTTSVFAGPLTRRIT